MKVNHLLSALLNSAWAIDPRFVDSHWHLVEKIIAGDEISFQSEKRSADSDYGNVFTLKDGRVAVIPVTGPITKYDGFCYEAGSITRSKWLARVADDPAIEAAVILFDTPGGQVSGTPDFAASIAALNAVKPTLGFVEDLCASAGMWSISGCEESYANHALAEVGSIGVFTTLLDNTEAYAQKGYKKIEIYAPESSEKNKEYRDAMGGDPKGMEARLSLIAQNFIEQVSSSRGSRLTSDSWNKGRIMHASEGVQIGLIDGIRTLDQVADRALELVSLRKTGSGGTSTFDMKFEKLTQEAKAGQISDDAIDSANTELTEAGITSVTLVRDSIITEGAAVTAERDELKTKLDTAEKAKGTAETEVATLKTQVSELQTKLAAAPGAAGAAAAEKDKEDDTTDVEANAFGHNRAADGFLIN